ncbi:SCF ubiquitin ligase complex subunit cdc4 [Mortierella sp. AD032]|nr:SCF ubiquitin ligase complex subunit cdc4 [Mortierella sp. AD032]
MQLRNHNNDNTTSNQHDQHASTASPEEKAKRIIVKAGDRSVTSPILDSDAHRIITTIDDGTVRVYSALTGALFLTLSGHQGGIWASALCRNTLVTGATDRNIRVWDLLTGVCTHVFVAHTSTVRTLQIVLPINTPKYEPEFPIIVAGSRDKTVSVWRLPIEELNGDLVATEQKSWLLYQLTGHTQAVRAVAGEGNLVASASYDTTALGVMRLNAGLLVSASADGTTQVWDPVTSERLHIFGNHPPGQGESIQTTQHDGEKLVMGFEGAVQTWDIRTGELLHETTGVGSVWQIAYNRRRRVVAFNPPEQEPLGDHNQTYLEILDYCVPSVPQASSH